MLWWIGLVALILAWFLGARLARAARMMRLIEAGRSHLWTSFRMLSPFDRALDGRVWSDPYLLGYAQSSLATMTDVFGGKLNAEQRGRVLVEVLRQMVGGDYGQVCERVIRLGESGDAEFGRGMRDGTSVAALMANRPGPELLADPDVQQAMRDAPGTEEVARMMGERPSSPLLSAGANLMNTYMERHRRAAGF